MFGLKVAGSVEAAVGHLMSVCPFLRRNPTSPLLPAIAAACPVMRNIIASRGFGTAAAAPAPTLREAIEAIPPLAPQQPVAVPVASAAASTPKPKARDPAHGFPVKAGKPFDYDGFFEHMVDKKKKDNSYRIFNSVNRIAPEYPKSDTRTLVGVEQAAAAERKVTVWCSNDYLGMSRHPDVVKAAVDAVTQHGVGSGGTRNISGTSMYHQSLEAELAGLHGKESALVFTSCFVGNDAALSTIGAQLPDCVIFSDQANHSSMIQGIRHSGCEKRVFRHNDINHLEELLKQYDRNRPKIVAFETVYSMSGSISPLNDICDLAHEYNALTFVDEVHAVGMYGSQGAGVGQQVGCEGKIDMLTGTLAKAYGVIGGYMAASKHLVDTVRSYAPGFIFTTSLPPMICASALKSIQILKESSHLRNAQQASAAALKNALRNVGIPFLDNPSHIVPVLVGDAKICKQISDDLFRDYGIYVQSINYPTVSVGTERLRITPGPFHTEAMMKELVSALVSVWGEYGLPLVAADTPVPEHYYNIRRAAPARATPLVHTPLVHTPLVQTPLKRNSTQIPLRAAL
eukprot:m.694333 g.694333  ORF g.694333 m.694333 type:complete len:571 (-) comp58663_c0_seq9:100-1812(-)